MKAVAIAVAACAACGARGLTMAPEGLAPAERSSLERSAAYSRSHGGLSMVVVRSGEVVFEDYAPGVSPGDAHNLYSGTKSFSCALAVAASMDGLLDLDERVSETIGEWKGDAARSEITVRQLLSLTSGLDAGKTGRIPGWQEATGAGLLHEPGAVFQYGPVPFQIFGEIMRRKLGGEGPVDYLSRRVLDPIGLEVDRWRTGKDGNPKMPAGAFLTARSWARYGQLVAQGGLWEGREVLDPDLLAECFVGSAANPAYGLTFWLPMRPGGTGWKGASLDERLADLRDAHVPDDLVAAAGVGGQKLYIVPSMQLVVARQARRKVVGGWGFEDALFLEPLFEVPWQQHVPSSLQIPEPDAGVEQADPEESVDPFYKGEPMQGPLAKLDEMCPSCKVEAKPPAKPAAPYLEVALLSNEWGSPAPGDRMNTSYHMGIKTAKGWYLVRYLGTDGELCGGESLFWVSFDLVSLDMDDVIPGGTPEVILRFSESSEGADTGEVLVCGIGPSGEPTCVGPLITTRNGEGGSFETEPVFHDGAIDFVYPDGTSKGPAALVFP